MNFFDVRSEPRLRPGEVRLMKLLTRVSDVDMGAIEETLGDNIRWDRISHTALKLGAAPLFYYHLNALNTPGLETDGCLEAFRTAYFQTMANNLYLAHEFDQLVERLSEAGIAVMALKGMALCRTLYPSPALRPMVDIDLLAKPDDLDGVFEVVQHLGYPAPEPYRHGQRTEGHYHLHCIKQGAVPVILEIHWGLGEPRRYRIDEVGIWSRAQASPHGPYLEMSDDDTFLYLAMHFFKHFLFKRLSWLCDLHEWTRQREINWDRVAERARSQSLATFLGYTLTMLEDFYEEKLPLDAATVAGTGPIRKNLLDWYLREYPMLAPDERHTWLHRRLFAFASIDRLSDRLRFTWDALKRDVG